MEPKRFVGFRKTVYALIIGILVTANAALTSAQERRTAPTQPGGGMQAAPPTMPAGPGKVAPDRKPDYAVVLESQHQTNDGRQFYRFSVVNKGLALGGSANFLMSFEGPCKGQGVFSTGVHYGIAALKPGEAVSVPPGSYPNPSFNVEHAMYGLEVPKEYLGKSCILKGTIEPQFADANAANNSMTIQMK